MLYSVERQDNFEWEVIVTYSNVLSELV